MSDEYAPVPPEPPPQASSRPPWLIPVVIGVLISVIVALALILIARDDSSDVDPSSSAAASSTVVPDSGAPAASDPPPSDPPPSDPCPEYTENENLPLALCDSGTFVSESQTGLVNWGAQIDVDGFFGAATEAAVRDFQSASGLAPDGIIGENTWDALCPFTNNLCEPDG
jgi:peptidoglycan hydrolase-like protein with peptidoglycan-binding domain